MNRLRLLFFVFYLLPFALSAQPTRYAVGLRATPDGGGGTIKLYFDQHLALESQVNLGGLFTSGKQGATIIMLLEYHVPLPAPAWNVFFGGGAHYGIWSHTRNADGAFHYNDFILGIDGIGGVVYKPHGLACEVSFDLKPAVNIFSEVDFYPQNILGFSARYYFGRRVKPHSEVARPEY